MQTEHVTLKWDKIAAKLFMTVGNSPITGKAPTVAIYRKVTSEWLQAGGGSWSGVKAVNTMVEVDSTDRGGVYIYTVPGGQLDHDDGKDGYEFYIEEVDTALLNVVFVEQETNMGLETSSDYAVTGTFGLLWRIIGGLLGFNMRIKNFVWDAHKLKSITYRLFPSSASAVSDAGGHFQELTQATGYDTNDDAETHIVTE